MFLEKILTTNLPLNTSKGIDLSTILSITLLFRHILINNWANGWILPKAGMTNKQIDTYTNNQMNEESRSNEVTNHDAIVILFFLPQLLEFLGFLLLPIPFIGVFLISYNNRKNQ